MCVQRGNSRGCLAGVLLSIVAFGVTGASFRSPTRRKRPARPRRRQSRRPGMPRDILNLDIDQLAKTPVVVPSMDGSTAMDTPVTSVTKEASTVGRSAAAVFVITNEMIRRSGATCIPEALRMAPGLEVAQINSNTWAITSRGFNSVHRQQAAGADRRPDGLQSGVFGRLLGRARRAAGGRRADRSDPRARAERSGAPTPSTA